MKCWVIFALLLLLEISVTHRLRGKLADAVKVLTLAWCLAPTPYNGSDLMFGGLLAPLHWAVTSLATSAAPCLSCLISHVRLRITTRASVVQSPAGLPTSLQCPQQHSAV